MLIGVKSELLRCAVNVRSWAKQHWSPSLADQVRRSAYTHEYDSAVKSVAARLARENPDRDPTEITLLAHRGAALLVNELATARHAALRPQALVAQRAQRLRTLEELKERFASEQRERD